MCNTASWVAAGGTIFLGFAAIFGDWARSKIWKPKLNVSIKTSQPDCLKTGLYREGQLIGDCIYLRLWVENDGNDKARDVEVYAKELRRKRRDETWEIFPGFPSMNLRWADSHETYFPSISSRGMGKHCDLGPVCHPSITREIAQQRPSLRLSPDETSLSIDLSFPPPNQVNILGPGLYQLDILVAADNHKPFSKTVEVNLSGKWYDDPDKMLRDGVGVKIL